MVTPLFECSRLLPTDTMNTRISHFNLSTAVVPKMFSQEKAEKIFGRLSRRMPIHSPIIVLIFTSTLSQHMYD